MSTFPFKAVSKTRRSEGKVVVGIAIDDYFEQHVYGYKVEGIQRVMRSKQFQERYDIIREPLSEAETKRAFALLKVAYEPEDEQVTAEVLDKVNYRAYVGLPIRSIGVIFFLIYELIAGDKTTFRADDVIRVYKENVTATCGKCGHKGKIKDVI